MTTRDLPHASPAAPSSTGEPPERIMADAGASLAFTAYLRVAAMSAVVLIHTLSGIVENGQIRGSLTWWAATTLDLGSSWSVPAFIMVSGTLLLAPRPGESAGAFYRRRLHRIAIPLVVANVGYLLVRAGLDHETLTPGGVAADLLRATVYVHLYFFWIILGLYLVTPLLRPALAGRSRRDVLVIGAAAIAWMWAVQAGAQLLNDLGVRSQIWQPAALVLFLPYVGYFVLGHALRDAVLPGRGLVATICVFVVADAVVVWQYSLGGSSQLASILAGGGYQGLPVAVSTIALFLIARTLVRPSSAAARAPWTAPMRRLGELSLGVFIVHLLVLRLGRALGGFDGSFLSADLPRTLLLWLGVTVASFALCFVVARIPLLRRTIGL